MWPVKRTKNEKIRTIQTMIKPLKNVYGSMYLITVLVSLKNEDGSTWIEMVFYVDDKILH